MASPTARALAAAQAELTKLRAEIAAMRRRDLDTCSNQDLVMDVMVELVRGLRPGHVAYVRGLAQDYIEKITGTREPLAPMYPQE